MSDYDTSKRTGGKLTISCGAIYESVPRDDDGYPIKPIAIRPYTLVRPPVEIDSNLHHLVNCWNAFEIAGIEPRQLQGIITELIELKRKLNK